MELDLDEVDFEEVLEEELEDDEEFTNPLTQPKQPALLDTPPSSPKMKPTRATPNPTARAVKPKVTTPKKPAPKRTPTKHKPKTSGTILCSCIGKKLLEKNIMMDPVVFTHAPCSERLPILTTKSM